MAKTRTTLNGVVAVLERTHAEALEKSDRLHNLLTKLRYEGKFLFGKNLEELRQILKFFNQKLAKQMRLKERFLFPFLVTHIPKLEPVLDLLSSERDDFRKSLKKFDVFLKQLSRTRTNHEYGEAVDQVVETGTYLVYLVRHQIRLERKSVSKAIQKELRENEKATLRKKLISRRFLGGSR